MLSLFFEMPREQLVKNWNFVKELETQTIVELKGLLHSREDQRVTSPGPGSTQKFEHHPHPLTSAIETAVINSFFERKQLTTTKESESTKVQESDHTTSGCSSGGEPALPPLPTKKSTVSVTQS